MSTVKGAEIRVSGQVLPSSPEWTDRRLLLVSHNQFAHTIRFPETRDAWETARHRTRERILLSAGLLPFPKREPVEARVWGHSTIEACHVAQVSLSSLPGIRVTGTLYLPEDASGPVPGILSPHGHWQTGRVHHDARGSIPARCLTLAKLGFAVFSYDMIGYNDSTEVAHRWPTELIRESALYGISPFGIQLWNSIRATDFLASLPEVDAERLGCTGASGGASQTWNLAAVDDRIKVIAPVCMLSSHFQGGCTCEEGPLLRIDGLTSADILAAIAPRPVFLPSVTGDWTNLNPRYELPKLCALYEMLGCPEHIDGIHFDDVHNYNQRTREYVYAWFARWLQGKKGVGKRIPEPALTIPAPHELRHGDNRNTTDLARTGKTLKRLWKDRLDRFATPPASAHQLRRFTSTYRSLLHWILCVDPSPRDIALRVTFGGASSTKMRVSGRVYSRRDVGDVIPAYLVENPTFDDHKAITIALMPNGKRDLFPDGTPSARLVRWLKQDGRILVPDLLGTGDTAEMPSLRPADVSDPLDIAFNNSLLAMQVQDVLTLIAACKEEGFSAVSLRAEGHAARVAILAMALTGKLAGAVIDLKGVRDTVTDWMQDAYHPLVFAIGGLRGAIALAPATALTLKHCPKSVAEWARAAYELRGCRDRLSL